MQARRKSSSTMVFSALRQTHKPVQEAMTELLAEFGCDAAEGKVMDAAELREQADLFTLE